MSGDLLLIPMISEPKVFNLLALSKKVFNLWRFGEIQQRGQETFCTLDVRRPFLLIPTISEPKVFYLLALSKKVFNLLAFGEISQRGQETFCILEVKRPFCSFLHK